MSEKGIFKSYLRVLLRQLKHLQTALKEKDYNKAEKLINEIIKDTEKGIED